MKLSFNPYIGYKVCICILQEIEIALLRKEIEFLRQNITTNNFMINSVPIDEYVKLEQENIKLKYRVAILKRVCFI